MRVIVVILSTLIFLLNTSLVNATEVFEKYPSNAEQKFPTANQFYNEISRDDYTEPSSPVYSLREKTYYKDVNNVFERVPYKVSNVGNGAGFNPQRQVYIFVSTEYQNGKLYYQHAVFDAETKRMISGASGITN